MGQHLKITHNLFVHTPSNLTSADTRVCYKHPNYIKHSLIMTGVFKMLVNKFATLHEIQSFTTTLRGSRDWTELRRSASNHPPYFFTITLIILLPHACASPKYSTLFTFCVKILHAYLTFPKKQYIFRSTYTPSRCGTKHRQQRLQFTITLITTDLSLFQFWSSRIKCSP